MKTAIALTILVSIFVAFVIMLLLDTLAQPIVLGIIIIVVLVLFIDSLNETDRK